MYDAYYSNLYKLQDEVLRHLGELGTPFYLTGGTALSRFFLHHRYSDDLDLFVNWHPEFEKHADRVRRKLHEVYGDHFKMQIDQPDFKRMILIREHEQMELKVELINDVPYHAGEFWGNEVYDKIDSWRNILTNKICALSRNEEKDLLDLLFLAYKYDFNWMEVVDEARKKDDWVDEIRVSRYLHDVEYISGIKFIDKSLNPVGLIPDLGQMARDVLSGGDNSLVKPL